MPSEKTLPQSQESQAFLQHGIPCILQGAFMSLNSDLLECGLTRAVKHYPAHLIMGFTSMGLISTTFSIKKTLTKTSTTSFTPEDPAAGMQGKPTTTALKAVRVRLRRFLDCMMGFATKEKDKTTKAT